MPNKNLIILYAFSFFKSLQFFGALAVPFYTQRIGFNYLQIFSLEAIFSIALVLFEIPTGIMADKYGRKVSLFIGSLFMGLAFIGYGFTYSFLFLSIFQITAAFGASLISGADKALVYETASSLYTDVKKITSIAGTYNALETAAMFIAFPLGSMLTSLPFFTYTFALAVVFVLSGICFILSAVIILFIAEKKRPELQEHPLLLGKKGLLFLFSTSSIRRIAINSALISSITFLMFWLYQAILQYLSFPVKAFGFIAALFNAGGMILLLFLLPIQKRLSNSSILFITSISSAILYLLCGFYPTVTTALLSIFGITIFRSFRLPIVATIINDKTDDSKRATVLSGLSMIERFITTVFYLIVGFINDISIPLTFILLGFLTLCISIFLPVREKHLS